jgi:hypothetical protein
MYNFIKIYFNNVIFRRNYIYINKIIFMYNFIKIYFGNVIFRRNYIYFNKIIFVQEVEIKYLYLYKKYLTTTIGEIIYI